MNHKLISELALKSYIVVGDYSYCQSEISPEKFAELIVKECIEELESVKIADYATDDWDKGYDAGLTQAIETIKEHFGVK